MLKLELTKTHLRSWNRLSPLWGRRSKGCTFFRKGGGKSKGKKNIQEVCDESQAAPSSHPLGSTVVHSKASEEFGKKGRKGKGRYQRK